MMDLWEAMEARHSVRRYTNENIEGGTARQLRGVIAEANRESGLSIQLFLNEPAAFEGAMARYGKFENVQNYIAIVGKKGAQNEEKAGYYGEKVVLHAQRLDLNTCWVALTYSKGKSKAAVASGEKVYIVISIGYGETNGIPHKSKTIEALSSVEGAMPEWFRRGMQAVQLAPTAMNQQKFTFRLEGTTVSARPGFGFYTKLDLGIAKYHFEVGAGRDGWRWG